MRARVIALAAAAVAYVLVTHWLMTGAPASPWNAVMVVGPMLGAASVVAWQRRQRLLAALVAMAPEAFAAFVKGELAKYQPLVKASGARVE